MIDDILKRNEAWSARIRTQSPEFFPRLAAQQSPEFFWIGCSDSRVPANVVAGLDPGEVFVHRNVANVIHSSDMNMLSTLEFAVNVLKVREVMITGHYGCGGVIAAMDGVAEGLTEHWLEPVRRLARRHKEELETISDRSERIDRLCELNVLEGVARIAETPVIRQAWARRQEVNLHGLCYGLKDGILRDLGCTLRAEDMWDA